MYYNNKEIVRGDIMKTGDIIKKRRKELHLTLKDVADYIGVSEATISRYETGDIANMGRDKIAALAKVLKLSPGIIAGYDEEETPSIDDEIIRVFRQLSEDDKAKVIEYTLLLIKASEQGK